MLTGTLPRSFAEGTRKHGTEMESFGALPVPASGSVRRDRGGGPLPPWCDRCSVVSHELVGGADPRGDVEIDDES